MFLFLTVVQALVAAALVGVILMQRSEGGGLGIGGGGSPGGLMSARGAADFLTKSTRWLAIAFVALSIALAAVAVKEAGSNTIESTLGGETQGTDALTGLGLDAEGEDEAPVEETAPAEDDPLAGATE